MSVLGRRSSNSVQVEIKDILGKLSYNNDYSESCIYQNSKIDGSKFYLHYIDDT